LGQISLPASWALLSSPLWFPVSSPGLLRECPAYQPSTPQLRFLLRWVATDLAGAPSENSAAFGLLRSVLGRRLMVPEVYDAMDRVQEVMIK
jgi:U3 small nucleolar RNA-associated protein 20